MARNNFGCICDICGAYTKNKLEFFRLTLPTYESEYGNCVQYKDYCTKCYINLKELLKEYYKNEKGK